MECHSKRCKKLCKKKELSVLNDDLPLISETSLSSISDIILHRLSSCKNRIQKLEYENRQKKDYLTRIYEKKKLKEKSLSKKIKTPFDRKLNRTCWPIELTKISKIKKRPREKKKKKPSQKSIRKKFFKIGFDPKNKRKRKSKFEKSETKLLDDDAFHELLRNLSKNHFLHEPVTPQMLIGVLQDPELLNSGATIDTIIKKLRALKLSLNPALELLKEEVLLKLECAIKLGLVTKHKSYYRIADTLQVGNISRKKVRDFWKLWYRELSHNDDD